jgi:hypothetical protein
MKSSPLTPPTLSPGCAKGEGAKSSAAGGGGAGGAQFETPSPLAQPGERAGVRGLLCLGAV